MCIFRGSAKLKTLVLVYTFKHDCDLAIEISFFLQLTDHGYLIKIEKILLL